MKNTTKREKAIPKPKHTPRDIVDFFDEAITSVIEKEKHKPKIDIVGFSRGKSGMYIQLDTGEVFRVTVTRPRTNRRSQ